MQPDGPQRFMIGLVSLALAFGWFYVRDLYQRYQPMPDVALIDEFGGRTSLDRLRTAGRQLVIVYLPPSMMNCPGIQSAGRTCKELASAVGTKARIIGLAENGNAGGIHSVRQSLEIPFPVYLVDGKHHESRALMNALSESSSAMSRRTIAGSSVVLDDAGYIAHRSPDGRAAETVSYLAQK